MNQWKSGLIYNKTWRQQYMPISGSKWWTMPFSKSWLAISPYGRLVSAATLCRRPRQAVDIKRCLITTYSFSPYCSVTQLYGFQASDRLPSWQIQLPIVLSFSHTRSGGDTWNMFQKARYLKANIRVFDVPFASYLMHNNRRRRYASLCR